ncbi:MAG: response regulator transcription factor [Reinekea forsetii]|uniref:Transcriptional regulator, LuxR family n=1 Tax=Reinekea forsetii TaxID=1336806 RepID=A0A2K8KPS7_9GAMM|nr:MULTISPECIES: response regulator transcription factor [Reinekea]ATX76758.1 transcriptional regulator, LuxR family [Reinekea forsetii]MDB9894790.1 response regulator transcription factor [Reinekea forsetii]MDO7674356.1 response regulator transcription factor [Reinekea forsetii]
MTATAQKMIRVMLVDDQNLVREGIKSLLNLAGHIDIVGEAGDGEEALSLFAPLAPDVVLMDIRMPKLDGVSTLKQMKDTGIDIPVIILTTFDDHELVLNAIRAGARGFLLKDVSLESLVEAIDCVHRGETMIQPAVTERVIKGFTELQKDGGSRVEKDPVQDPLTQREIEILRLMAGGYSNKEISRAIFKSEGTIKNHVSNILAKLGVRDRTRAVLKALELGII